LQRVFVSHVNVHLEILKHHFFEPIQLDFLLEFFGRDLDDLDLRLLLLVLLSYEEVGLAAEHTVEAVLGPLAPWDRHLERSCDLNWRCALLRLLDWGSWQSPCLPEPNLAVAFVRDLSSITLEDSLCNLAFNHLRDLDS